MLSTGYIIAIALIALVLCLSVFSYTTALYTFNWHLIIFDLGIRLERYEEYTENYEEGRVRKELTIGFLFGKVVINYIFPKELVEVTDDNQ
jgi:hypothetical protein